MAKYAYLVSSASLGAVTALPDSFSSGSLPGSSGELYEDDWCGNSL